MRAACCLLVVLSGCLPILCPPAHVRLGAGYATKQLPYKTSSGTIEHSNNVSEVTLGFDSAALAESPVTLEGGLVSDFKDPGAYVEVGPMWRLLPQVERRGRVCGGLRPRRVFDPRQR